MDLEQYLPTLLNLLSRLDFVEKIDFQTEAFILKGRAILKENSFLQVYYNDLTGTQAFVLIKDKKRIWGIDYDRFRGWHKHTLKNPEGHLTIRKTTLEDIIKDLEKTWSILINKS